MLLSRHQCQCHLKTITFQCIYGFGMLQQSITGIFKEFWAEGKITCQGVLVALIPCPFKVYLFAKITIIDLVASGTREIASGHLSNLSWLNRLTSQEQIRVITSQCVCNQWSSASRCGRSAFNKYTLRPTTLWRVNLWLGIYQHTLPTYQTIRMFAEAYFNIECKLSESYTSVSRLINTGPSEPLCLLLS